MIEALMALVEQARRAHAGNRQDRRRHGGKGAMRRRRPRLVRGGRT